MSNPVMQWQIISKEPDKVANFYRSLFGWSISTTNAIGYREVQAETGGMKGGISYGQTDELGAARQDVERLGERFRRQASGPERQTDRGGGIAQRRATLDELEAALARRHRAVAGRKREQQAGETRHEVHQRARAAGHAADDLPVGLTETRDRIAVGDHDLGRLQHLDEGALCYGFRHDTTDADAGIDGGQ